MGDSNKFIHRQSKIQPNQSARTIALEGLKVKMSVLMQCLLSTSQCRALDSNDSRSRRGACQPSTAGEALQKLVNSSKLLELCRHKRKFIAPKDKQEKEQCSFCTSALQFLETVQDIIVQHQLNVVCRCFSSHPYSKPLKLIYSLTLFI